MTGYTFVGGQSGTYSVDWSDPAIWSGTLVPNSPSADVVIPAVNSSPYAISLTGFYDVDSLSITANTIDLDGTLAIAAGLTVNAGSVIEGTGTIGTTGTIVNNGDISGFGLDLYFGDLQNYGTVGVDGNFSSPIENDGIIVANLSDNTPSSIDFFSASSFVKIESAINGTGSIEIAPGIRQAAETLNGPPVGKTVISIVTLDLQSAVSNDIVFENNVGEVILDNPQSFTGSIEAVGNGDSIVLSAITAASVTGYGYSGTSSSGTLTIQETTGSVSLSFLGNYNTSSFQLAYGIPTYIYAPPTQSLFITATPVMCYAAGTRIATLRGDMAVEELKVGDVVTTVFSETAAIRWIGHWQFDCRSDPNPRSVWPVRILAHAFGNRLPARDLYLSPDHAVFVDNVLIPIRELLNGTTVSQVEVDTVTYYHIELPLHDVVFAENLPAESYLDIGSGAIFSKESRLDAPPGWFTGPPHYIAALWDAHACAPLALCGPIVAAVSRHLVSRSTAMMPCIS